MSSANPGVSRSGDAPVDQDIVVRERLQSRASQANDLGRAKDQAPAHVQAIEEPIDDLEPEVVLEINENILTKDYVLLRDIVASSIREVEVIEPRHGAQGRMDAVRI